MVDTTSFVGSGLGKAQFVHVPAVQVEDHYWGYVISDRQFAPDWAPVAQAFSFFLSVALFAAAAGLLIVPGALTHVDGMVLRFGFSVLMVACAVLLLHYGMQGYIRDVQLDQNSGEIREVMRGNFQKSRLIGHFGFDAFTSLSVNRCTADNAIWHLRAEFADRAGSFLIASGNEAQIAMIQSRVSQDLG